MKFGRVSNTAKFSYLRNILFCLALILSFLYQTRPAPAASASADQKFRIKHGGVKRFYIVHVPPGYKKGTPVPVVLNFHGGGGTPEGQIEISQMNETSDEEGFIAVYPQGTGNRFFGRRYSNTWNAGRCCGAAQKKKIDDVGFVSAMLDKLEKDFSIDTKKIYATGISNGAQMSYRLACELSERIAAIAPVASADALDECRPSRPVPVIHFHGADDPDNHYLGGLCGGTFEKSAVKVAERNKKRKGEHLWTCASVPDTIAKWRQINECHEAPEIIYSRGESSCAEYDGCKAKADVVLCRISKGGHTWPNGTYGPVCKNTESKVCKAYSKSAGPISPDIPANEEMWRFFRKHPLP